MEITLPPDLLRFIEERVKAGQFSSAEEMISRALSLLRDEERLTPQDLAELREDVRVGLEQLERGEGAEWDAEETKTRLRERLERTKRAS